MVKTDYLYVLLMFLEDGTVLGQVPVMADWEPAAEHCIFTGIRQGRLSESPAPREVVVAPLWSPSLGEPYVYGVRVSVLNEHGQAVDCAVPITYFRPLAEQVSAQLVAQGTLKSGQDFRFLVQAFVNAEADAELIRERIEVETVVPPLPLKTSSLGDYLRRSNAPSQPDDADMPVFIPSHVLEEVEDTAKGTGSLETGGILAGYLRRDAEVPEVFLEVTVQIPARHTKAELTRLTLTPDTWADVQNTLRLRGRDETILGWWHSHSYMKETCKDCRKARDGTCTTNAAFMSSEDCSLHRICFPRAFSVALVVSSSPCAGVSKALFGWRHGMICSRRFHMLDGNSPVRSEPLTPAATAMKGDDNA